MEIGKSSEFVYLTGRKKFSYLLGGIYLNILYASDNGFARILAVSIASLLKQNIKSVINVYVLDSGISSAYKEVIANMFSSDKHNIYWIRTKSGLNENVKIDRGSEAQFSRLFLDYYLPKAVKRVLYLDCDTYILEDLSEFYEEKFNKNVAIIGKDPFSKKYRHLLHLPQDAEMYNSGIMLIDRERYHNKGYEQKCLDVINRYGNTLIQGDQGILDIVFQNNVKILNPRFNLISSYFEFSYSELKNYRHMNNFYSHDEIKNGMASPAIIHFTSDFLNNRPWFKDSKHPFTGQWRQIEMNIFGDNRLEKSKSRLGLIFYFLPRSLAIKILGVLQAYVRPFLYSLRRL